MGARQGDQGARRTGTESALLSFFRLRFQCTVVGMRGKKKTLALALVYAHLILLQRSERTTKTATKRETSTKTTRSFSSPLPCALLLFSSSPPSLCILLQVCGTYGGDHVGEAGRRLLGLASAKEAAHGAKVGLSVCPKRETGGSGRRKEEGKKQVRARACSSVRAMRGKAGAKKRKVGEEGERERGACSRAK